MCKAISGLAPSYLNDLISIKTGANYSLRSVNELILDFPLRKSYSWWPFFYVWNSLLNFFIRRATSVNNFKSQLKTYDFKLAYFYLQELLLLNVGLILSEFTNLFYCIFLAHRNRQILLVI